jgi:hypothetical protein
MSWCGALEGAPTWAHWTFSPCLLETVGGSLLLFVTALVLAFQCRKVSLLRQRRYSGQTEWTREAIVTAIACGILIVSHAAVLVITSILSARSGIAAPYNIFSEAALFIVWLAALVRPLYLVFGACTAVHLPRLRQKVAKLADLACRPSSWWDADPGSLCS